jgi:molybdenum cofactor cytidylyltransferase
VIRQLRQIWDHEPAAPLIVPTYRGRRGHPTLVAWDQVAQLRTLPPGQGLNVHFRQLGPQVRELPVEDENILADLDTPEDYARLLQRGRPAT